jgi:RNA polymerase sigma factor (sigma-70 family)
MKGRYLGSRGSGRSYANKGLGIITTPSGCECREAFRCFASGDEFLATRTSYALDLKSKTPATDFKPAPSGLTVVSRELLVVPCQRQFLKPTSDGTKAYRALKSRQSEKSTFSGCEDVDQYLRENALLNYDMREGTGTYSDVVYALEVLSYEDEIREQNYEALFSRFSDRGDDPFISDVKGIRSFTAQLEKIRTPGLHLDVHEVSDQPETPAENGSFEKRIGKAMKRLTPAQRKAVRAVYLENGEGRTQAEIAASFGISLPSLRDRLTGAFNKIADEFQDSFPGFKKKEKKTRWTPKRKSQLPLPVRITSYGVTREFVPTEKNPRPLGPVRTRAGIDQDRIREKLWAGRRHVGLM